MIYQRQRNLKLLRTLQLAFKGLKLLKEIKSLIDADQEERRVNIKRKKEKELHPHLREINPEKRKDQIAYSKSAEETSLEGTSSLYPLKIVNVNEKRYMSPARIIHLEKKSHLKVVQTINQKEKNLVALLKSRKSPENGEIDPDCCAEKKKRKPRSCCVRKTNLSRHETGFYATTFKRIKENNELEVFFSYTRMNPEIYDVLLKILTPFLEKTSMREPIHPDCRLAVLLIFLAQGTTVRSLAQSFQLGKATVRQIILETADAIWKALSPTYMTQPNVAQYNMIAEDFNNIWNMPNCIGAIGGKHIALRHCPKNKNKYNSEKYLSIVLLAISDAKYRFTTVDVGDYGKYKNGGNFETSELGRKILNNEIEIPPPVIMQNTEIEIPCYFIGDGAFPLASNLMRAYTKSPVEGESKAFNGRLSHANKSIENTFGILVSRWRILLTPLQMYPENSKKVILACVVLHNFLILNKPHTICYCPDGYVDWEGIDGNIQNGLWRSEIGNGIPSITPSISRPIYGGQTAIDIRNRLRNFLNEYEAIKLDY